VQNTFFPEAPGGPVRSDTLIIISVFSVRYIFRRLSPFLWSDSVVRFCLLKLVSTFIEPSAIAKPTLARVLGTNQRSRARLI
jgi:hypothetical protein